MFSNILLFSVRVRSQQQLPCFHCDFSLQPVHQRCDQSLLAVVGGEDQQHGVPGQTLKTVDTASLSGEERVALYYSLLDSPKAPQQLQDFSKISQPLMKNVKYCLSENVKN